MKLLFTVGTKPPHLVSNKKLVAIEFKNSLHNLAFESPQPRTQRAVSQIFFYFVSETSLNDIQITPTASDDNMIFMPSSSKTGGFFKSQFARGRDYEAATTAHKVSECFKVTISIFPPYNCY